MIVLVQVRGPRADRRRHDLGRAHRGRSSRRDAPPGRLGPRRSRGASRSAARHPARRLGRHRVSHRRLARGADHARRPRPAPAHGGRTHRFVPAATDGPPHRERAAAGAARVPRAAAARRLRAAHEPERAPPSPAARAGRAPARPLHWWWRRRGTPRPRPALALLGEAGPPLDRWADAGESRAVASVAAQRLRSLIAARMPSAHPGLDTEDVLRVVAPRTDWPLGELADLLARWTRRASARRAFPDAVGLARSADELAPRLVPEAA